MRWRRSKERTQCRYLDEFLMCRCAPDMLEMELFPNVKEVTESFAAYDAVRTKLFRHFQFADPSVVLIAVGDGNTPRTGATFAYRSRWACHSVDPYLKDKSRWMRIGRLALHTKTIEECAIEDFRITTESSVVIAAVHSHAPLEIAWELVQPAKRVAVVAIPCCVQQKVPIATTDCYEDVSILSPQRSVVIWERG